LRGQIFAGRGQQQAGQTLAAAVLGDCKADNRGDPGIFVFENQLGG
jgi:hypothetical protein